MDRIETIKSKVSALVARHDMLKAAIESCAARKAEANARLKVIEDSIAIMQSVSSSLQIDVRDKIVHIVQAALDATFAGCLFKMEFVSRRDKTEIDLLMTDKDGNEQDIIYGQGGGLKDIVSFALRIALWTMGKTSSVILLDEPFKFLSEGHKEQGAELLKKLSADMGIQFIVVSHEEAIINAGDSVNVISEGKLVKTI